MRRCVARYVTLLASGSDRLVSPVNIVLCSLRVLKRREVDVRNPAVVLIASVGVAIAGTSHSALAQGDKSTTSLLKHTATGKHYDTTTLTPHKPKAVVTEQKASKKTENTGNQGGGTARPHDNTNPPGGTARPHDDTNPPGGTARPHDDTNPPGGTARPKNPTPPAATGNGPKLTPDRTGVKNISR